jgi:hypothetical protein
MRVVVAGASGAIGVPLVQGAPVDHGLESSAWPEAHDRIRLSNPAGTDQLARGADPSRSSAVLTGGEAASEMPVPRSTMPCRWV